jgi:3-oxoacyl-[acyl-carrier-protein] synthase-1
MRTSKGIELIQDEALKELKQKQKDDAGVETPVEVTEADEAFLKRLLGVASLPLEPSMCVIIRGEHEAFVTAVRSAISALEAGRIDKAIVGSVDSLIDHDVLIWLYQTGRLKCGDMPVGLQPGEAAAFMVLETPGKASGKSVDLSTHSTYVSSANQETSLLSGHSADGTGLSQLLTDLGKSYSKFGTEVWILTDQNGEPYRAYEWGLAQTRVSATYPAVITHQVAYPALSFGDTGAAAGAVGTCMAMSALERRYATAPAAWVVTSSSDGRHGAVGLMSASLMK